MTSFCIRIQIHKSSSLAYYYQSQINYLLCRVPNLIGLNVGSQGISFRAVLVLLRKLSILRDTPKEISL